MDVAKKLAELEGYLGAGTVISAYVAKLCQGLMDEIIESHCEALRRAYDLGYAQGKGQTLRRREQKFGWGVLPSGGDDLTMFP